MRKETSLGEYRLNDQQDCYVFKISDISNASYIPDLCVTLRNRWIEDYIQPAIQEKKVDNFKEMLEKTRLQVAKKVQNQKKISTGRKKHYYSDPDETETEDSGSDDNADDKNSKTLGPKSKEHTGKKNVTRKAHSTKAKIKENKKKSEKDLIAAIRNRNGRGNPLASIAAKYGVSTIEDDPIDDQQFDKLKSKYLRK